MNSSDSTLIRAALGTLKTASEFKDSRVAEICAAFGAQLNSLLSQGRVYRGADGIPDNVENADASHDAQAWLTPDGTWVIHIDGDELDKAATAGTDSGWEKVIADWLLREVAHTLGYRHPGETVAPYATEPFNHASGGPAEQCVR
ncbi:MAG TPA: hypothetical protein VFS20_33430 [Longimicrobium sp.]|nr:hypothetical protein [Longimicrobium sp.]